eukprot:TRINITY_DN2706_c0_g1_i15.p1 TRINITY_DN2706_c0_g1~~TRINITY_DN2706_c0_g1_i15.p1  ORF type:complete len:434 (+),score=43.31 TRINITY_DN2706_c0_g1_i15:83-1384(+)
MCIRDRTNRVPNVDFELFYESNQITKPTFLLESTDNYEGSLLGVIRFSPDFSPFSFEEAQRQIEQSTRGRNIMSINKLSVQSDKQKAKFEYIFIFDRSGSMEGDRISFLRDAAQKMVSEIPLDSYFNIICFGSNTETLYEQSRKFDEEAKQQAINKISKYEADLGGTEVLVALEKMKDLNRVEGYQRLVFLVSDGEVYNTNDVVKFVSEYNSQARFYSVGIGNGVSEALIKGIAKAGYGQYVFIKQSKNIEEYILRLLYASISPYMKDISIQVKDSQGLILSHFPYQVPLLFKNELLVIYLPMDQVIYSQKDRRQFVVEVTYIQSNMQRRQNMSLMLEKGSFSYYKGDVLHKFYANEQINRLSYQGKDNEELTKQIVQLSTKYQVLSEKTAFILVVKKNEKKSDKTLTVNVPSVESNDHYESYPVQDLSLIHI